MSFFPNTSRLRQNIQNLLAQGIDSKLKFSLEPVGSETGVEEWKNAMKAVTRLPGGIPNYFRAKLWITLADEYFSKMCIDWKEVQATCLSEKIQQDDTEIDSQIIKDLHRTGWNGFNEEKKLKQVLLAYARYNKEVGYCQGFNIIAALILQVVDFKTDISLKVMIFVIEQVLPQGYFDHSLRALSVDMAVMKDLILQRLPKTIQHLEMLQSTSGNEYEPPLTNVFSMHWFLTLFATCLPRYCVYRIWDAIMLEGSEILLRTAIALWAKMSRKIIKTKTADEFYTLMEELCKQLTEMNEAEQDNLILVIYTMSEFPYPGLSDLRDKYTWNIQPLSNAFKLFHKSVNTILHEDGSDGEITSNKGSSHNVINDYNSQAKKTDLHVLHKQYKLMKIRQKQAAITLKSAYLHGQNALSNTSKTARSVIPNLHHSTSSPPVFNHLLMSNCLANGDDRVEHPTTISGGALTLTSTIVQPMGDQKKQTAIVDNKIMSNHNTSLIAESILSRKISRPQDTLENRKKIGDFEHHSLRTRLPSSSLEDVPIFLSNTHSGATQTSTEHELRPETQENQWTDHRAMIKKSKAMLNSMTTKNIVTPHHFSPLKK